MVVACVASVSNRVIARKLELSLPPPFPVIHFFFSLLSQLSRRTSQGSACYAGYYGSNISGSQQWGERRRRQRERQKSNRFILAKQQLCPCITLFCIFLSHHCKSARWNFLIWRARFMESMNTAPNFFSKPYPFGFNPRQSQSLLPLLPILCTASFQAFSVKAFWRRVTNGG